MKKWEIAKNKLLDSDFERPVKVRTKEIIKNHKRNPSLVVFFYSTIGFGIFMIINAIIMWFFK